MSDFGGMTIAKALRGASARLAGTSDTARLDAELLMAHVLGTSRSELLLRHMQRDALPHLASFDVLVARRAAHEPVAYLLGRQEFYGRDFAVMPGVLIPRSDSEVLIDAALSLDPAPRRVIDLGTGSGALLVTCLLECPAAEGVGIDASDVAANVAASNASGHGLAGRAQILRRSWRDPDWAADLGRFDLVLCNPPYVESGADLPRSVIDFEPSTALFAGSDGLDDYESLIPQLDKILSTGGKAIFEIGYKQADAVSAIAVSCGFCVEIRHDLGGRARAVILTRGVGKAFANV